MNKQTVLSTFVQFTESSEGLETKALMRYRIFFSSPYIRQKIRMLLKRKKTH